MALALYDRVRETTTVLGTNDAILLGAVTGFQSFAAVGNTNTCYYTIADNNGNWEVGLGTYSSVGPTLARTTVYASSNAGNKVSFPAGTKDIFLTYPAEKAVQLDANGDVSPLGTIASGVWQGTAVTTTYGGTGLTSYTAGDLPYYATGTTLSKLAIGTSTYLLTSTGSAPQWSNPTGLTIGTATNIAGGAASQIPYQSATGTTAFVPNGTSGQVLKSNGASAPSWGSNTITLGSTDASLGSTVTNITGLTSVTATTFTGALSGNATTATTATNLAGGAASQIPYQSATGTTAFSANLAFNGTTLAVTGALTTTQDSSFNSTGATKISSGTTAQRPAGTAGQLRFNSTTTEFEGYNGTAWASVGGSAISNDTATSTNLYPIFVNATTGTATNVYTSNAKYLYKPSTGELQAPEMVANNGLFVNSATVTTSYTIPTGSNAMSAGPVAVADGVTVTIPSGSNWVIV